MPTSVDAVSTLASLWLKVPTTGHNFWTLGSHYVSAQDEIVKSYSQWSHTPDALFSQGTDVEPCSFLVSLAASSISEI